MKNFVYELHSFRELDFPMIFDFYHMNSSFNEVFYHWHIDIEMLYFISGSAEISINGEVLLASAGDVVIINSNHIHYIKLHGEECKYYCLIMDHNFCREIGFDITVTIFSEKTSDPEITNIFNIMIRESINKRLHWKKAIRALGITMNILLYRNQIIANKVQISNNNKSELIKMAIEYINRNLKNEFCLDDIATELCISKYYFCRIFKDITGQTLKGYLLTLRCLHARTLLQKGNINIIECAQMCGFNNSSYFTKCYKNQFGYLPSCELKT
jgi:AraC-like DNA-binding protein